MKDNRDPVCHIVGAGDFFGMEKPEDGDCVIAADGGLTYLESISVIPDLILGDFDSMNLPDENPYKCTVMRYSSYKDDTDMMLAIHQGLARGYRRFMLYGGTGGRLDHTLANIQCLQFLAERECTAWLVGDEYLITALCGGGKLSFPEDIPDINGTLKIGPGSGVSVFAQGGTASGVTISGMKYELRGDSLKSSVSRGVSNSLVDSKAHIALEEGCIVIYMQRAEL